MTIVEDKQFIKLDIRHLNARNQITFFSDNVTNVTVTFITLIFQIIAN